MTTIDDRLTACEGELRQIRQSITEVRNSLAEMKDARASAAPATTVAQALNGEYDDPVIRRDPPRWKGESHVGKKYSQCPPDYLECLAGFLRWKADKNATEPGREKYATYDRLDAARALAWAAKSAEPSTREPGDDFPDEGPPLPW